MESGLDEEEQGCHIMLSRVALKVFNLNVIVVIKNCLKTPFRQFLQRINTKSTFNNATLFCVVFLTDFIEIIKKIH